MEDNSFDKQFLNNENNEKKQEDIGTANNYSQGFADDGTYRFSASNKQENDTSPMYEKFNVYDTFSNMDYNTSGADYGTNNTTSPLSDEDSNDSDTHFYNTNIKKKGKRVPLYTVIIAVVLTAGISLAGAFGYDYAKSKMALFKEGNSSSQNGQANSQGSAVVATASEDRNGKKVLSTPEIVDRVGPAVVGVLNTTQVTREGMFYEFFGGGGSGVEQSTGSGVIISDDGYIVTNNHVIEGAASITVIMNTGDEYTAKLVGADSKTDLAVLKIEAEGLTYASMGSSSDLRVGDTAIAIGNPLGQEFAGTTTQGIISGLNRSVTIDNKQLTLIQTDAAINPGNSGGALVDAYGHLIGINTAKISSSTLEGLGFAIPIDVAKPIIAELIDNGYVTGRPILGIGGRAVTEEDAKAYNLKVGIYVTSMTPDSPAYLAGIKIGDTIVECEGKKVATVEELNKIKNKYKPGDKLSLKIYRQGQYKTISVILGEEAPSSN